MSEQIKPTPNELRKLLRLYAVSESSCLREMTLEMCVEKIISGGVSMLQYRNKEMSSICARKSNENGKISDAKNAISQVENNIMSSTIDNFYTEARKLQEICKAHNTPLIINDNIELAKKIGADGVHVGQDDIPCSEVRAYMGNNSIIGVSAQTKAQAIKAQRDGADYLGVGAMIFTHTKPDAIVVSMEELREITSVVDIPVVVIGGINANNVQMFKGCGITGVAVVSALFGAENPRGAAKDLSAELSKIL